MAQNGTKKKKNENDYICTSETTSTLTFLPMKKKNLVGRDFSNLTK